MRQVPAWHHRAQLREILDPYLVGESAHAVLGAVHRASRSHGPRRHLVYVPRCNRGAAAAELSDDLQPREVMVLRRDEAALEGLADDRLRHITSDGVELTVHRPAGHDRVRH